MTRRQYMTTAILAFIVLAFVLMLIGLLDCSRELGLWRCLMPGIRIYVP